MEPEELLESLLSEKESDTLEFKDTDYSPVTLGQAISALANAAVLENKSEAYLILGVSALGKVVGTDFDPDAEIVDGAPFKSWLAGQLGSADTLTYHKINNVYGVVVIVRVPRARVYPVKFDLIEYVRIDKTQKELTTHPEIARKLWEEILRVSFEDGNASDLLSEEEIYQLLDFRPYYSLRDMQVPNNREVITLHMLNEGVLIKKLGKFYISNLGALLFARDMSSFSSLLNRGVRLIKYKADEKTIVERAIEGHKGYAIGINDLINTAMLLLPSEEYTEGGTRKTRQIFPLEAIRELTSNMLMHQDFAVTGFAPRIEIYADRIEFTNSGSPVIAVERFLDSNQSRNPKLARLMRVMQLCEERGMGIDIVEDSCAKNYLPSVSIKSDDGFTHAIIYGHKTLRQFSGKDRTNLVYTHCSLQYVKGNMMTNESLRSRFGEGVLSSTVASRWISETIIAGYVRPYDPESSSRKNASYVPSWA